MSNVQFSRSLSMDTMHPWVQERTYALTYTVDKRCHDYYFTLFPNF